MLDYINWAKSFNLKQMAQTLNYLTGHKLLDYAVLSEKTAEATARYNELSGQIKATEKRMAEIAVLRTHNVNYAKMREVYIAYRKRAAAYEMCVKGAWGRCPQQAGRAEIPSGIFRHAACVY